MTPSTPPKRRLSLSHFQALLTPATAKKIRPKDEAAHQPLATATVRVATPLTPEITPQTHSKSSRSVDIHTEMHAIKSSATRARLRLEAEALATSTPQRIKFTPEIFFPQPPLAIPGAIATTNANANAKPPSMPTGLGIRGTRDTSLSLHVKAPDVADASRPTSQPPAVPPTANSHTLMMALAGPVPSLAPCTPVAQPSAVFGKICSQPPNIFDTSEDEDGDDHGDDDGLCTPLVNPFVEPKKRSPTLINPFVTRTSSTSRPSTLGIDYSTKLELYNARTGKYFVRDLSAREKKIKPKKLDFSAAYEDENTEDIRVSNKRVPMKSLNGLGGFIMDINPKNSLGFDIFNDEDD